MKRILEEEEEIFVEGTKRQFRFQHEALELDDEPDGETEEVTKRNNLIDMDRVHEYMSKSLLSDRLTKGYALFGKINGRNLQGSMFSSASSGGTSKISTPSSSLGHPSTVDGDGSRSSSSNVSSNTDPEKQNERTRREIIADFADNSRHLYALNRYELLYSSFIYRNTPAIRNSMAHFKTQLFKRPFKVSVVFGKSEEEESNAFDHMTGRDDEDEEDTFVLASLNKELEELIVQNKWTPMLEEHYKWQKLCGVVPIYFEPVGVKQTSTASSAVKIHYVPKIPLIDSGTLYTYLDKRNRQNFVWEWTGNNGMMDTVEGIDISDGGWADDFGGSGEKTLGSTTERRRLYVKRSRFMFFDVPDRDHVPSLSGDLQSDFKSIIGEWRAIAAMRQQMMMGAERAMNPECIIEFTPDLSKVGSTENIDLLRLYLEYQKLEKRNPPFGGLESYSSAFGENLEPITGAVDNHAGELFKNLADRAANQGASTRYDAVARERDSLLARGLSSYADNEIGLIGSGDFGDGMTRPPGQSATGAHLDKLKLEALNNPGGTVSHAFKQMNNRTSYPSNAKRLEAFEKVGSGPKITIPNYNLYDLWTRFDDLVSSICDFPPELLQANGVGGSAGAGQKPETSTAVLSRMDIFKERIKKKAKTYEILIRQLWVMAYAPFKQNTAQDLQLNQMLPNIDPSVLKTFDQIRITIPIMPFMDMATALKLYKDGFLNIVNLHEFMVENYLLPKMKMTVADYKKLESKLQDGFDREDGLVLPPEPPVGKKKKT